VKLLNFEIDGRKSFGALAGQSVIDLRTRLSAEYVDLLSFVRAGDLSAASRLVSGVTGDYAVDQVRLLNPAGRDIRYFCIGVNYPERNEEYRDGAERPKYPSVFMRTHTSFVAPEQPIVRPRESEQLDYEGEIAVVVGRGVRRISRQQALDHIFGYTCANDGSVRDWLRHSKFNVTQGKNFDRSGSLGPWIVTRDDVGTDAMRITTRVNGETRQEDTSDRMLFPIAFLIEYLSTFCTLEAGDIILTGTPSGAGARLTPPRYLQPGDVVEVEVSGVGTLRNTVIDDGAEPR
jgi:2-keto-4-pentenoate hydratase/2-oxohepta-3-ene-1,7-dioic acid hydratase in catechol pathway